MSVRPESKDGLFNEAVGYGWLLGLGALAFYAYHHTRKKECLNEQSDLTSSSLCCVPCYETPLVRVVQPEKARERRLCLSLAGAASEGMTFMRMRMHMRMCMCMCVYICKCTSSD